MHKPYKLLKAKNMGYAPDMFTAIAAKKKSGEPVVVKNIAWLQSFTIAKLEKMTINETEGK